MPLPVLAAGVLDEDAAHGLGRGSEEVTAAVPVLGLFDVHQPQVRLVDQGGGLEGLVRLLLSQPLGRQPAQFVVDQRQEFRGGGGVALLDGGQDARDIRHAAQHTLAESEPRPETGHHSHTATGHLLVTSISNGRIPWPRGRVADAETGGGSGLLVFGDLARAVRTESAAAVRYWWGVGCRASWNWRRALGVDRVNNEGTHQLQLADAEAGGRAAKARGVTEAERKKRRRTALRGGYAKRPRPHPGGAEW